MKKYITDEKTGISYTLHGDYYLPDLELTAQEEKPIGIWGCGCPVDTSEPQVQKHRPSRQARPAASAIYP